VSRAWAAVVYSGRGAPPTRLSSPRAVRGFESGTRVCWTGPRAGELELEHPLGKSATRRQAPARRATACETLVLHSRSAQETRRLGKTLGALLARGDVLLLTGALGAGKTALTQGIARGLAVPGVVNSPTFTILKEYAGRLPLYHFDLYRIEDPAELEELGFAEYFFGEGVSVVEWAERGESPHDDAAAPWPADALHVRLDAPGPQERTLRLCAAGARGRVLLSALANALHAESESRTR